MNGTAKIKGLGTVLRNMKIYSKKLKEDLTLETARSVSEIERQAKLKVIRDYALRQSIYSKMDYTKVVGEVGATLFYAPYVEFGTGLKVKVPQGYESFAMQFYVNGKGKTGPSPYLIPSFLEEMKNYKKNIQGLLDKYSGLKSIKRL